MSVLTRDKIEHAAAKVRAGWSTADHHQRGYQSDIDGFFHLTALILGADKREADRLFRCTEAGCYTRIIRMPAVEIAERT